MILGFQSFNVLKVYTLSNGPPNVSNRHRFLKSTNILQSDSFLLDIVQTVSDLSSSLYLFILFRNIITKHLTLYILCLISSRKTFEKDISC